MSALCAKCSKAEAQTEDADYAGLCALCAWRKWFKDSGNAEAWAAVECIECELGRWCATHPHANCPDNPCPGIFPHCEWVSR
jgi:hypothetical protein